MRHMHLLALMLASGAMRHEPEIFLGRDIGSDWPTPPQTSTGKLASNSNWRDAVDAAEAKRERRRLRNIRNQEKSKS